MNAQLNYALKETLSTSKWIMLIALFSYFIFFSIDVISYLLKSSLNYSEMVISLCLMSYSIAGLIICIILTLQSMILERQYR